MAGPYIYGCTKIDRLPLSERINVSDAIQSIFMRLVFPNLMYKEKAIKFIDEFYEYQSDINGTGALDAYLEDSTYEEWIEKVLADNTKIYY